MNPSQRPGGTAVVEPPPPQKERAATVETWLGRVLRIGVTVTVVILLVGLGLFLVDNRGASQITRDEALGRGIAIHALTPTAIIHGVAAGSATSVIQLGLLALILTPVVRVAVTTIFFWRQRDWSFVLFSGVVLVILILGLLGIGA